MFFFPRLPQSPVSRAVVLAHLCLFAALSASCSKSDSSSDPDGGDGDSSDGGSSSSGTGGEGDGMGGDGPVKGSGGSDGAGGSGGNNQEPTFADLPQGLQDYCEAAEAYTCEFYKTCYGGDSCDSGQVQAIKTRCNDSLPALWAAGLFTFDADLAKTCLPKEPVCTQRWADVFDTWSCRNVLTGTIAPGESCVASNAFLIGAAGCNNGSCVAEQQCGGECVAYPTADESCAARTCGPGRECVDDRCADIPEDGEKCTSTCVGSLRCVNLGDGKRCHAGSGEGGPCSEANPCATTQALACKNSICVDKVALGEPCTSNTQCPTDSYCFTKVGETDPTCNPELAENEECVGPNCGPWDSRGCEDPDPNDGDPTTVCVKRGGWDEPCEPHGCTDGLWCYYPEPGNAEDGICKPQGGIGDSCESAHGRRTPALEPCLRNEGIYCIDNTCRAASKLGGKCDPFDPYSCEIGEGWCSFTTKRCEGPADVGDACSPLANGNACVEGAYCDCINGCADDADSGTCTKKKKNTASCTSSTDCLSGTCDYSLDVPRCVPAPAPCDTP